MTPSYSRNPADYEALKDAKELETYTIKKVCNTQYFSKKKYRLSLKDTIAGLAIDCYVMVSKAYYAGGKSRKLNYLIRAFENVGALLAQIDAANKLYTAEIGGLEYWSELCVKTKDAIGRWIENTKT